MLDNKQRESDRFLLVVKQQLVQAQQELFDELVLCFCHCSVLLVSKNWGKILKFLANSAQFGGRKVKSHLAGTIVGVVMP